MGKIKKNDESKSVPTRRSTREVGSKRKAVNETEDAALSKSIRVGEEIKELDVSDEEFDDEEGEEDEDILTSADAEEVMNTDVEGFPLSEDDREGVINLLTQIFLRNGDVNVPEMADAMIAQEFGLVLGPAEDESDDDNQNMVYGLLSALEIDVSKGEDAPKYAQSLVKFLMERANKFAVKETLKMFENILSSRVGFLVNERMLHFPSMVVPQSFSSFREDLGKLQKPYKYVLYIQKIRVVDEETAGPSKEQSQAGKKKKVGKAEKKRLAAAAVANAEVLFDNVEDAELFKLNEGTVHYFDYHVHNDVEPGSRFHVIEEGGKKLRPFRRAVLMDQQRVHAFVDKMVNFIE